MINALLDTNIYDLLARDSRICNAVARLVASGHVKVFASRTIAEELHKSPFGGVPSLFPIEYVGNTVGRAGIMRAGDSLGSGDIYYEHLGESTKLNDAFIVDAASRYADWLVSEDERLRKRTGTIEMRSEAISYEEFVARIEIMLAALEPQ